MYQNVHLIIFCSVANPTPVPPLSEPQVRRGVKPEPDAHKTNIEIVRAALPVLRGITTGVDKNASFNRSARPGVPNRSATKEIPEGLLTEKAPKPSASSHEKKKLVSVGPAIGAHGREEETKDDTPAGQVLTPGLPVKEYVPGAEIGTDPIISVEEPSDGIVRVSLIVETSVPSTYIFVLVADPSPCVSARWCHLESQAEDPGEEGEDLPHDRN